MSQPDKHIILPVNKLHLTRNELHSGNILLILCNKSLYQIFSHNNIFLFGAKAIFLSDINDKYPIILSFIYYNLLIIDYKLITDD